MDLNFSQSRRVFAASNFFNVDFPQIHVRFDLFSFIINFSLMCVLAMNLFVDRVWKHGGLLNSDSPSYGIGYF